MQESRKNKDLLESVKKVMNGENITERKVTVPANLMKEFEKLINKYRDSGLKGADSFDRKTILDDEKELRKVFDLLKRGEIDKAWDEYEDLDTELQLSVVPDRIVQFMDQNLSR